MRTFINDPKASDTEAEYSALCDTRGEIPPYVASKLKDVPKSPLQQGDTLHLLDYTPLRLFLDNGLEFRLDFSTQIKASAVYHLPDWLEAKDGRILLTDPNLTTHSKSHEIVFEQATLPWSEIEDERMSSHKKIECFEKRKNAIQNENSNPSKSLTLNAAQFSIQKLLIAFPETTLLLNRRDGSGLYWGFVRKHCPQNSDWLKMPDEDSLRPYRYGGGMEVEDKLKKAAQTINQIWDKLPEQNRSHIRFQTRLKKLGFSAKRKP